MFRKLARHQLVVDLGFAAVFTLVLVGSSEAHNGVVAAVVLFVGSVLALLLVRRQDFVASGPEAGAAAG